MQERGIFHINLKGFVSFILLIASNPLIKNIFIAILLSSIISFFSYKFKLLNYSGTTALFILAVIIYGFGSWKWTIPILTFFILSSLISKIKKSNNINLDNNIEKSSKRNHIQVLANGGVGGILVTLNYFFPSELFYFAFVSSIAAVCADTWSTEIGTMYGTTAINILTFKTIQQGISGGVSLIGTLGGVLGAIVISLSSMFWISSRNFTYLFFIIFAGIIGNIFDSIIGASIQAKYRCTVCSKIVEKNFHCNQVAVLKKGFKYISNDMVNLAAAITGGLFGILFIEIF